MLLQFTLPNVRIIFILMIAVVASAMPTCAAKPGFVFTLKGESDHALHINSHGKVSAEHISLAQYFTLDSVGDVLDFTDFKITIYAADVNYFLCFHHGRLVGKRNATKDCHLKESMVNGYYQFAHAYNPVHHVGFKRNFRPVGPKDLAKPRIMEKAIFSFYKLGAEHVRVRQSTSTSTTTTTAKTTSTTSTTPTPTPTPPSTTKSSSTNTPTTIAPASTTSPVAGTKRTRSKPRRPTSINSDSIPSEGGADSQSNSLKSYNQANSNNDEDLLQQQRILQRNRKQDRLNRQQQRRRKQRLQRQQGRRTVGLMAQPQPKNLEVRHHHNNATLMERRRRRRLEHQQHKLQRELWEREQRQAGEVERERERKEHHLPKAASSSASSSSSSSTATSTALTATAASLAPSAFNLVAIVAASRRKRDRRKRSAEAASPPPKSGGAAGQPAADMQLVELPSQRQPQNTEYSKPYVNSNLNNPLKSSNSVNVNHAIPALPKNYNYLYSNEHYNLNTKSSTTDSSSLDTSTKFDSPNSHSHSHSDSHSHSHSHSDSHSHSAFNQNIDNNLKQLKDRIEEIKLETETETESESEEGEMEPEEETASEEAAVENRNHIDANNIIDDPSEEEHEELILNKLFRGLQELPQQQQQQQQQQPNIDNHNENINVVNNNQNNDSALLTNNNHNSNYNEQFANDDETIRIQNNKYETHIVQYKHVVFISENINRGRLLHFWQYFSAN